jgi:hypothetical protein
MINTRWNVVAKEGLVILILSFKLFQHPGIHKSKISCYGGEALWLFMYPQVGSLLIYKAYTCGFLYGFQDASRIICLLLKLNSVA